MSSIGTCSIKQATKQAKSSYPNVNLGHTRAESKHGEWELASIDALAERLKVRGVSVFEAWVIHQAGQTSTEARPQQ